MIVIAVAIGLAVAILLAVALADPRGRTDRTSDPPTSLPGIGPEAGSQPVAGSTPDGPGRTWPNRLSAAAGVIVGFCGTICVATVAGMGIAGAKLASTGLVLVFAVLEVGVVVFLAAWARRLGGRGFLRGLIIGAGLALLLSAACWGIVSVGWRM